MSRAILFAFLSVALFGAISCAAIENELSSDLEVLVVDDIKHYLEQNQGVELLQEFERSETKSQLRYTLGSHVAGTIFWDLTSLFIQR